MDYRKTLDFRLKPIIALSERAAFWDKTDNRKALRDRRDVGRFKAERKSGWPAYQYNRGRVAQAKRDREM